jgi:hypothetical protein
LKKRDDEGITESHENDILYPFLNKDEPIGRQLNLKDANDIKKLVLEKFRERIIARADIIHKRIEDEKAKVFFCVLKNQRWIHWRRLTRSEPRKMLRRRMSEVTRRKLISCISLLRF